jgi:hypothetical protein
LTQEKNFDGDVNALDSPPISDLTDDFVSDRGGDSPIKSPVEEDITVKLSRKWSLSSEDTIEMIQIPKLQEPEPMEKELSEKIKTMLQVKDDHVPSSRDTISPFDPSPHKETVRGHGKYYEETLLRSTKSLGRLQAESSSMLRGAKSAADLPTTSTKMTINQILNDVESFIEELDPNYQRQGTGTLQRSKTFTNSRSNVRPKLEREESNNYDSVIDYIDSFGEESGDIETTPNDDIKRSNTTSKWFSPTTWAATERPKENAETSRLQERLKQRIAAQTMPRRLNISHSYKRDTVEKSTAFFERPGDNIQPSRTGSVDLIKARAIVQHIDPPKIHTLIGSIAEVDTPIDSDQLATDTVAATSTQNPISEETIFAENTKILANRIGSTAEVDTPIDSDKLTKKEVAELSTQDPMSEGTIVVERTESLPLEILKDSIVSREVDTSVESPIEENKAPVLVTDHEVVEPDAKPRDLNESSLETSDIQNEIFSSGVANLDKSLLPPHTDESPSETPSKIEIIEKKAQPVEMKIITSAQTLLTPQLDSPKSVSHSSTVSGNQSALSKKSTKSFLLSINPDGQIVGIENDNIFSPRAIDKSQVAHFFGSPVMNQSMPIPEISVDTNMDDAEYHGPEIPSASSSEFPNSVISQVDSFVSTNYTESTNDNESGSETTATDSDDNSESSDDDSSLTSGSSVEASETDNTASVTNTSILNSPLTPTPDTLSRRKSDELEEIMGHLDRLNDRHGLEVQRAPNPSLNRRKKIETDMKPIYDTLAQLDHSKFDPETLHSLYATLGTLKRQANNRVSVQLIGRSSLSEEELEKQLNPIVSQPALKPKKSFMRLIKKRLSFGFLKRNKI